MAWVKAVYWHNLWQAATPQFQNVERAEGRLAWHSDTLIVITSDACLDLILVTAAWTVGLSCSLRSSRNQRMMRLFFTASIPETLLPALTLRAKPCTTWIHADWFEFSFQPASQVHLRPVKVLTDRFDQALAGTTVTLRQVVDAGGCGRLLATKPPSRARPM